MENKNKITLNTLAETTNRLQEQMNANTVVLNEVSNRLTDMMEFLQENMVMLSEFNGLEKRFDTLEQKVQIFRLDITDRMDARFAETNRNLGGQITRLVDVLKQKRIIDRTDTQHILATT